MGSLQDGMQEGQNSNLGVPTIHQTLPVCYPILRAVQSSIITLRTRTTGLRLRT